MRNHFAQSSPRIIDAGMAGWLPSVHDGRLATDHPIGRRRPPGGCGRVLVRRVAETEPRSADLLGAAGIVWIACDEPATADALAAELELPLDQVTAAVDVLLEAGWVEARPEHPAPPVGP